MMRWRKLGRIYAPASVATWAVTHASVPIAMALGPHEHRVFFSSRDRGNRSYTGYFDTDLRDPNGQPLRVGGGPALSPGGLGMFDEDGAMGSWIVQDESRLLLYYIGWNLGRSVPFRNSIGLAESFDGGENFSRVSVGPVLDRGIHDPCFTASPCVLLEGGRWRMWYLSCFAWERREAGPMHRYHIKYAESGDGLGWQRDGLVAIDFALPGEYALARPSVIRDHDCYRMWYSRRGTSYRIGYAESLDGVSWQRRDEKVGIDVSESGWDSEMICYPFVFDAEGQRYMLYNGNGYGASGIGLAVLEAD
ncbi:MAG: hypothetical protein WC538_09350 [Thermoanaerobaculia bacterium]|jgi:hypothetical protein